MMQEILADLENLDEIPEDILEELQREIARNEEANRLAKQREVEAKAARDRAAQSKAMMSTMEERYLDIQNKVETTRQTLSEATGKLERQNKLTEDLEHLKQMVEHAADQARPSEPANLTSTSDILNSLPSNGLSSKKVDYASIVEQLQTKLAVQDCEERSEQVDRQRAANEIAATVRRLEEKSANVKAKIEQIALYEESLKTRRAQLMATKREREALKAVEEAKKKEEEALEMRCKVLEMQERLLERKLRLQEREKELTKKKSDFDLAEKTRLGKERRIRYVEKRKIEEAMFDLKKKM